MRVRLDRQALIFVLQGPDGHLIIRLGDGRGDGVDAEPSCLELRGVEADAHGVGLRAINTDLGDARNGGKKWRDDVFGDFVHFAGGHFLAVDSEQQHRRIGRVGFAIARRRRHVARQLPLRARDCRLHIGGRSIDIAVEIKLQHDRAVAERVGGADFADAGNGFELLHQRRGDRGGHGLRRSAGKR
ncbi:hypothetical protein D3C72_1421380 [compost metagenome]